MILDSKLWRCAFAEYFTASVRGFFLMRGVDWWGRRSGLWSTRGRKNTRPVEHDWHCWYNWSRCLMKLPCWSAHSSTCTHRPWSDSLLQSRKKHKKNVNKVFNNEDELSLVDLYLRDLSIEFNDGHAKLLKLPKKGMFKTKLNVGT